MKKYLLISTLALLVITTTSSISVAENNFTKGLKDIGNQVSKDTKALVKDVKTSIKKDVDNNALAAKKAKIAEITKLRSEKLAQIDEKIKAKKQEIATVKKANILETERTVRLAVLNRELKYLETKKANIEKMYDNKINALK